MTQDEENQTQMLTLEKFNGWLMAAVLGLLSWNVYTTQTLAISVAVIEERTSGFNYSQMQSKIESLEVWVNKLSDRLADTQRDVSKIKDTVKK